MSALKSIPDHYVTQFETNWTHKAQQIMSKLKDCVTGDAIVGKEKSSNRIGQVEFTPVTGRAEETKHSDVTSEKRWLRDYPLESSQLFDQWDEDFLGQITLPTSPLAEEHAYAWARSVDGEIIKAALGTAYTGKQGVTPVTLPGAQAVAVDYVETGSATNSGLTIAKLRQAKFILDDNDVDENEPRTLVITAKQLQNLLRSTEINSFDYNEVKALVDGKVDHFLGFYFKRVTKAIVPKTGNIRSLPFWAKKGIRVADSGKETRMDILPTRSHALQIRSVGKLGATRDEEARVGVIYCDESV